MNMNDITNRIGYFRNAKNLSARELSLRIDKNPSYINHLEIKEFNLLTQVLLDIIEALEISCEEFFFDNYMSYKQDKEILNLLKNLPESRKNSFIDLMKNSK